MIDLHYRLAFTFRCIAIDSDKFSLVIDIRLVFIQPSSQISHHLDKLSAGEGRWIEFVRGIGIVMGGICFYAP